MSQVGVPLLLNQRVTTRSIHFYCPCGRVHHRSSLLTVTCRYHCVTIVISHRRANAWSNMYMAFFIMQGSQHCETFVEPNSSLWGSSWNNSTLLLKCSGLILKMHLRESECALKSTSTLKRIKCFHSTENLTFWSADRWMDEHLYYFKEKFE